MPLYILVFEYLQNSWQFFFCDLLHGIPLNLLTAWTVFRIILNISYCCTFLHLWVAAEFFEAFLCDLIERFISFLTLGDLVWLQNCTIIQTKHLYYGALPERDPVSAKISFPFTELTCTWTSIGLLIGVSVGMLSRRTTHWLWCCVLLSLVLPFHGIKIQEKFVLLFFLLFFIMHGFLLLFTSSFVLLHVFNMLFLHMFLLYRMFYFQSYMFQIVCSCHFIYD